MTAFQFLNISNHCLTFQVERMTPVKPENPKDNLKLGSGCTVCDESEIVGDVTIGNGTIVHPRAQIIAESGPIVIGEKNLIEDKACIINKCNSNKGSAPVVVIGNYNVFEVGSRCESFKVGDNNVFESKCHVGQEVEVSNNCIIGGGCVLTYPQLLPENCAVYGPDCTTKITQGNQPQVSQIDFLSKMLPTYHRIVKKKSHQ